MNVYHIDVDKAAELLLTYEDLSEKEFPSLKDEDVTDEFRLFHDIMCSKSSADLPEGLSAVQVLGLLEKVDEYKSRYNLEYDFAHSVASALAGKKSLTRRRVL